jgi:hypothetical protein
MVVEKGGYEVLQIDRETGALVKDLKIIPYIDTSEMGVDRKALVEATLLAVGVSDKAKCATMLRIRREGEEAYMLLSYRDGKKWIPPSPEGLDDLSGVKDEITRLVEEIEVGR